MPIVFIQIAAILGVALVVSILMRVLRQPLIVGYIFTGVLVGPAVLGLVHSGDAIDTFGQIGVVFLLFIVGLGLRLKIIRDVGASSALIAAGQIGVTAIIGYGLALWLGYGVVSAAYLAVAFTLSSTVVVLQLLYTKEEQDTLSGRLAIGVLLIQDFVAMLIFIFLNSTNGSDIVTTLESTAIKILILGVGIFLLTTSVVPYAERYFARSREAMFLFALTICFAFAAGFSWLGFSQELGALLAGVLLSFSPEHRDIANRLSPLRDFFLMMFFVVLGTYVSVATLQSDWLMIVVFSLFILIGNPLIMFLLMRPMQYTLKTSFLTALTMAEVSEFSLVLLGAGASLGHIPYSLLGSATAVGMITIFFSSYLIMHGQAVYSFLEPGLRFVFGGDAYPEDLPRTVRPAAILFGCHRLGGGMVDALERLKVPFLVVDHDPEITRALKAAKVPNLLGSADDPLFLEALPLKGVRTVISTIPETETNLVLIRHLRQVNKKAVMLCVANHPREASALYAAGATYVIQPPYLGRRYIIDLVRRYRLKPAGYQRERKTHQQELVYLNDTTR